MSIKAKIVIKDQADMEAKLAELAMVLHNLRYWTKYWKQVYGGRARENKEHWEKRADQLLDELSLSGHDNVTHKMVPRIQEQ